MVLNVDVVVVQVIDPNDNMKVVVMSIKLSVLCFLRSSKFTSLMYFSRNWFCFNL